jgi:hypothetical protein
MRIGMQPALAAPGRAYSKRSRDNIAVAVVDLRPVARPPSPTPASPPAAAGFAAAAAILPSRSSVAAGAAAGSPRFLRPSWLDEELGNAVAGRDGEATFLKASDCTGSGACFSSSVS